MKLIFLDIDGVLVTAKTLKGRSGLRAVADPPCVDALNRITFVTEAKLVISSSWRFCGLEEMRLILKYWGVTGEVIGITPDLTRKVIGVYSAVPRIREICAWLQAECDDARWIAIDDDDDMEGYQEHLVQTVFETGLTEELADRAIAMLMD